MTSPGRHRKNWGPIASHDAYRWSPFSGAIFFRKGKKRRTRGPVLQSRVFPYARTRLRATLTLKGPRGFSCRRDLMNLSADMATKINITFYLDALDAFQKAIME